MNVRLAAAVTAGKAVGAVSRGLGRGGGTALPGLVSERVDPRLVEQLAGQLGRGAVLVTGTNGKTTTSRILASIIESAGWPLLHNREGSNLMRGVGSALLSSSSLAGVIPRAQRTAALFEVDEAAMPGVTKAVRPRAIAFTNLFRDQLDRYGEVDTVFALWREAIEVAPRDTTLVLNADDPSVSELAMGWEGPVHWFGLDDPSLAVADAGAFDARWCRNCGGSFAYDVRFFAHVGHWRCTGCDRRRSTPDTAATSVRLALDEATFGVAGLGEVRMPLSGLYNVYNALAAIALARVLGVEAEHISAGAAKVEAAFGRQEIVTLEGRRLRLLLVKNPAGANQVLRMLATAAGESTLRVGVLLNDRFADGQDVSWIWDVDFELIAGRVAKCWAGGDRSADIALRLKYADWAAPSGIARAPAAVLGAILRDTNAGDDVFLLPTYTAMRDLRDELTRRGAAARFWKAG